MPWDIKQNYGGCNGYAVVKRPDGSVSGCHTSRESAERQMAALYASENKGYKDKEEKAEKNEEWLGKPLYDQLPDDEKALADSLLELAAEVGPLDKSEGIWVGYVGPEDNDNLEIGVKCGNCALIAKENACAILDMQIHPDGNCRFAVIPPGYVNADRIMDEDMEDNLTMKAESVRVGQMVSWNSSGGRAEGRVIRVVRNGKIKVPDSSFEINGTPEDPAVAIRVYRDGEPTDRTVGHRMSTLRVMSKIQKMWSIKENVPGCAGYALVDDDGELERCFSSKDEAERVMQEHNRKERLDDMNDNDDDFDDDDMSKRSLEDLDLRPTESMANNARRGLELRRKFGRGGTSVGVARARDLSNRKELSPETVGRMYSYFSRHEVDKKGKDWNNSERPSNGKIAWLLWGGDSGYAWAKSKWAAIQRIRTQKSQDYIWYDSALSLQKYIDKKYND